ncbi:MAG: flavodoxin reductase, partial [Ectothiorhodospiraceae bacterium]
SLAANGDLAGHKLLFSNRFRGDVIDEHELAGYLGDNAVFTLTGETAPGYEQGRIDRTFLERFVQDFDQHFYVCGPPGFTKSVCDTLAELGAESERLVIEG